MYDVSLWKSADPVHVLAPEARRRLSRTCYAEFPPDRDGARFIASHLTGVDSGWWKHAYGELIRMWTVEASNSAPPP